MAACGVGLGLKAQGSALVVTDIIEGGPVAKAGKVRKGDALVRVGKFRSGNVEDARQLLLGPPGSWVQLTFSRSQELMFGLDVGFQEPYTVEVMRSVPSNSFVEETAWRAAPSSKADVEVAHLRVLLSDLERQLEQQRLEAELALEERHKDILEREEVLEADLTETRIVAAQLQEDLQFERKKRAQQAEEILILQAELRGADERHASKLQDSERDREQLLEQGREMVELQQTNLTMQRDLETSRGLVESLRTEHGNEVLELQQTNLALQRSLALERTSVESLRIELGVLATEGQDERAATERCVASLEAANAEQEVLSADLTRAMASRDALAQELRDLRDTLGEAREAAEAASRLAVEKRTLDQEIIALHESARRAAEEKGELEGELRGARGEVEEEQARVQEVEKEKRALDTELLAEREAARRGEEEKESLAGELRAARGEVAELEVRVGELEVGGVEKEARARQLTNRVMELLKELERTHERQREAEERIKAAYDAAAAGKRELAAAKEEAQRYQEAGGVEAKRRGEAEARVALLEAHERENETAHSALVADLGVARELALAAGGVVEGALLRRAEEAEAAVARAVERVADVERKIGGLEEVVREGEKGREDAEGRVRSAEAGRVHAEEECREAVRRMAEEAREMGAWRAQLQGEEAARAAAAEVAKGEAAQREVAKEEAAQRETGCREADQREMGAWRAKLQGEEAARVDAAAALQAAAAEREEEVAELRRQAALVERKRVDWQAMAETHEARADRGERQSPESSVETHEARADRGERQAGGLRDEVERQAGALRDEVERGRAECVGLREELAHSETQRIDLVAAKRVLAAAAGRDGEGSKLEMEAVKRELWAANGEMARMGAELEGAAEAGRGLEEMGRMGADLEGAAEAARRLEEV
ncbi:hypothetical protein T484DRAFT_1779442 [Baffinella frigidus]|nr:hypothetical protein T484DRAFT_1779442 [Cryptophyta sp. CCMP2293]